MSLVLPEEIVAERFIPTVRTMLARALDERGMTQQQIATNLGVSQAAVSTYLGSSPPLEARFRDNDRMQSTIERIADGMVTSTLDEYDILAELEALIATFEDRGPICAVHEAEMPSLEGMGCDLCVRGQDDHLATERAVLADVRQASRRLQAIQGIRDVIPHVGTNIAMATPGATDAGDVAAIPGRIHRRGDGVHVPGQPEFGASKYVAGMILAAMEREPTMRAAVNIGTSDWLLEAADTAGFDILEFDPEPTDRGAHLRNRFESQANLPTIVYHRGAFGVEPITYILAATAVEAIDILEGILDTNRPK